MSAAELELKLLFDQKALNRFRRSAVLRELGSEKPARRKLASTYFDTPDLALHGAGASLRVRRVGRKWVQTLKAGTALHNGLSNPVEIEASCPGAKPSLDRIDDPILRARIASLVAEQPLQPVVQTDIWRTTRDIKIGNDGTVELAIDHGEVCAGGKTYELFEVELELKSGEPHALLTAAERLFGAEAIELSRCSKAQRGYALLDTSSSKSESEDTEHCSLPVLKQSMSPSEALLQIGRSNAEQILYNWRLSLTAEDPEGPHQLRIGLRRLRTAIRVFKDITAETELTNVATSARDLARVVGRLRDADVILDDIYFPAASQLSFDVNQGVLLDVLLQNRERERAAVRASLGEPRWTRLKLSCVLIDAAIERATFGAVHEDDGASVKALACKALRKAWRRTHSWGKRLDELTVPERHEMRKMLKSLRYATEFFLPLYASSEARKFLKQLKRLQDVFGYLNDVALAERLPNLVAFTYPDKPELKRSAALLCEWHSERADHAWLDARGRWDNLTEAPKFWRH